MLFYEVNLFYFHASDLHQKFQNSTAQFSLYETDSLISL